MEIREAQAVSEWMASLDRKTMEKYYLLNMLQNCDGDTNLAAIKAGISRRTLYRKSKDYGILIYNIRKTAQARKIIEALNASEASK